MTLYVQMRMVGWFVRVSLCMLVQWRHISGEDTYLTSSSWENNRSSRVQIIEPRYLTRRNGGYPHREALFGYPPYGGSMVQALHYAGANNKMCSSRDIEREEEWPLGPFILLIDRGECTFVTKVRNAQLAGASAVILADNVCLCSAGDACTSEEGQKCEVAEVLLADDGTGSDILIPSVMIQKQDADLIKLELQLPEQDEEEHEELEEEIDLIEKEEGQGRVVVELAWEIPSPSYPGSVEVELWMTPADPSAVSFLSELRAAAAVMGSSMLQFVPQLFVLDGAAAGCSQDGEDQCFNLCTNVGAYCALDPDDALDEGISGADVVTESLRLLCIWSLYSQDEQQLHDHDQGLLHAVQWWDYVQAFYDYCSQDELFTNEKCIADVMEMSNIDAENVDSCMEETGGIDGRYNELLQEQLYQQQERGVTIIPTLFVNRVPVRGQLTLQNVFPAICQGLGADQPNFCIKCTKSLDILNCLQSDVSVNEQSHDFVSPVTWALVGFFSVFACLGIATYFKY